MENYITTNVLSKKYGNRYAVNRVSMNISRGDIYGLIGPNGAGKTTLMKMIGGFSTPTEGEIKFCDGEFDQRRIGTLIEAPGIYPELTAFQNMKLKAIALGLYSKSNIEQILEFVGLGNENKKTKTFSLGMKQRLGIALAIIGNPDLLILDEPINGLDPQGIIEVRELLKKLSIEKHMTILISSHILEELSKIANVFGIISHGEMVAEMTSEELREKCEKKVRIVSNDSERAITVLEGIGITKYLVESPDTIYAFECSDRVEEIVKALVNADVVTSEIGRVGESLEEYYLRLIK